MNQTDYRTRIGNARRLAVETRIRREKEEREARLAREQEQKNKENKVIFGYVDTIVSKIEEGAKNGVMRYQFEGLPYDDFIYIHGDNCSVRNGSLAHKVMLTLKDLGLEVYPRVYRSEDRSNYDIDVTYKFWLEVRLAE